MKVAHIGWMASIHLRRRAEALAARGVETIVFTDQTPGFYNAEENGYSVELLPEGSMDKPFETVSWLNQRLKRHNVDILHIHSTHYPASLGFFCDDVIRITSIWDFVYSLDNASPLFHKVILDELKKGTISDYVSFSSKLVMDEWLEGGFSKENGFWHSWGVDTDIFSILDDTEKIYEFKKSHGIEPDEKIIFSPRTTSLPANADILFQAMPEINNKVKAKCILTGHVLPRETRYYERLLKNENISPYVKVIEPERDLEKLNLIYNASDAVVSIHSNDHNPATVLETMAAGSIPVINELKYVEYWVKKGRNGYVTKTRDIKSVADAVVSALTMPEEIKKEWQGFNRTKIETEANFRKTIDNVMADYETMLSGTKNTRKTISGDNFLKGLLLDIAGKNSAALEEYLKVDNSPQMPWLEKLITEKRALTSHSEQMDMLQGIKTDTEIQKIPHLPTENWEYQISSLPYPMSLFRHDYIAGLYHLVSEGRTEDYLYFLELLSNRFSTDILEWIGETIHWYGVKFDEYDFCVKLLKLIDNGGTSVAWFALQMAEKMPEKNGDKKYVIDRCIEWTENSIDYLSVNLDREVRLNVRERALELCGN